LTLKNKIYTLTYIHSHTNTKHTTQIITVALSMMVFHDDVTLLNVSGLLLAILGAVWYRQYKQKPSSSLSLTPIGAGTGGESSSSGRALRTPTTESGIFHLNGDSSDEEEEEGNDRAEGRAGEEEEEVEVEVEMYNISRAQFA
jgi:hypothetical protein